jgi:hypothetical protein
MPDCTIMISVCFFLQTRIITFMPLSDFMFKLAYKEDVQPQTNLLDVMA